MTEGYADAVGRILMDEVGGAVERVDDPQILFVGITGCAFLGNESCLGQQLSQGSHNEQF